MTRELRQLDEQCARALEWERVSFACMMGPYEDLYYKSQTNDGYDVVPSFSQDHEAAHALEDEIERRELQYAYTNALVEIVGYQPDVSPLGWACLRASPEQRARAFLEAVKP